MIIITSAPWIWWVLFIISFLPHFNCTWFKRDEALIRTERGQHEALDHSGEMGHSQALCHINLEFYLGNGIVAWGHWTGQPIYILLVSVLVWVCVCQGLLSFFSPYMTQAEGNGDASFWAISVLLHWPLGKLIFAGVSCSSFNCFTSLISSSLTTNSSPLFLLLPLFLTSSQAVRPWGCQGRNKVTGWWARHPMSDHMDWCCARHHSRWLAQQGSSHNTRTYCRPGLFFLFSTFPAPP